MIKRIYKFSVTDIISEAHKAKIFIQELDEYWADDDEVPEWRLNMKIGAAIR